MSPNTTRMMNIYHTLKFFNNNIYDYCKYHGIYEPDELERILINILYIDSQYQKEKDKKEG